MRYAVFMPREGKSGEFFRLSEWTADRESALREWRDWLESGETNAILCTDD